MSSRNGRDPLSRIKKELKKRTNSGRRRVSTAAAAAAAAAIDQFPEPPAIDQFARLPAELEAEIFSRMTLNEAARCSPVCKRWRDAVQLLLSRGGGGGVLDFDEKTEFSTTAEKQRWFANRVDQALSSVHGWDELRIRSNLVNMDQDVWRWVQIGLTKRVKRLTLLSSHFPYSPIKLGMSLPGLNPTFLSKQDLTRLKVLELEGLKRIPPEGTLEYIFSNCPSLKRFALHNPYFDYGGGMIAPVVRISCPGSNLESLSLSFRHTRGAGYHNHNAPRIELISAPRLRFFGLINTDSEAMQVVFGGDIARLGELRFGGPWLRRPGARTYQVEFQQHLKLEFSGEDFSQNYASSIPLFKPPPNWLPSGNLTVTVLDLHIRKVDRLPSLMGCTNILRAAPNLRHLCIWFEENLGPEHWEKGDAWFSMKWKHRSLQVLHLYGVHPRNVEGRVDPRTLQLELAAYIIMNSPSLNHVLIDTKIVRGPLVDSDRLYGRSELDARHELEGRLHHDHHFNTSHIHFTYQ